MPTSTSTPDAGRVNADAVIIGGGAAGLFTALHLPHEYEVVVVDKGGSGRGASEWAQGGVAAALGPEDTPELHALDTARVAAGHADPAAVAVLCSEAPECVLELAELGCSFDRDPRGGLHLAREGGQSVARSVHAGDATGAAIMAALRAATVARLRRMEGTCVGLTTADGRCTGAWVVAGSELVHIGAPSTILATGGVGALFDETTNPPTATGDGLALAWDAGAGLSDLEFVQFHPTALALGSGSQRLLLTEALRGAGAYVIDADGRRFLFEHHSDGELAPRDVVARAVSGRRSWLDCRHLGGDLLERDFYTVVKGCRSYGLDPARDLLPITAAAHYCIGGISTDLDGRTSVPRLYAVGECSNTGAHGANRLAGNSLAEALVFGRRAARAVTGQRAARVKSPPAPPPLQAHGLDLEKAWRRIRRRCSAALGVERAPGDLAALRTDLESTARLPPSPVRAELEVRSAAISARLVARAALLRAESRGVHHRVDHPDPKPEWAGVRLRLVRN